jgi:hypothetical protein
VQAHERIRGDLQVEVRALRRDEVTQRVIEIKSHDEVYIGLVMAGLELDSRP